MVGYVIPQNARHFLLVVGMVSKLQVVQSHVNEMRIEVKFVN
jgi:hypothetical protein